MLNIPTTQETKDTNLANLEGQLGQSSPLADKAFLRVLAAMEALGVATPLYKFAVERAKQNFALTGTGDDLDVLGSEYGVSRKAAVATVLTIQLPGTNGTIIPATVDFTGDSNGVRYFPDSSATVTGGFATMTVTAEAAGISGNLQIGDTLSIGTQIAGAETVADVTVIDTVGTESETDDAYRVRILDEIRSEGGGGNSFDYRSWAQEVSGVARAFPYAGQPSVAGTPPDRTVFVEADTTIDLDGIAPQALLDDVRDSITTDPLTGLSRQPLGLTDSTLWVESIIRSEFFIEITGLVIDAAIETETKSEIETAAINYFLSLNPFVAGLDFEGDKNDVITQLTISDVIQDILSARSGSATSIAFGTGFGSYPSTPVTLDPGEKAKLGTITNSTKSWIEETGPAYTDATTAFGSDATDLQIFAADDDRIYVGYDSAFDGIEVVLAIVSSDDIVAVFEYWNGSAWTALTVTDGTNGFVQSGDIEITVPVDWTTKDVNGTSKFYVRIQRTEDTVTTPPTEDSIRVESADLGVVYV